MTRNRDMSTAIAQRGVAAIGVPDVVIAGRLVPSASFSGRAAPFGHVAASPRRVLDGAAIRRTLPTPPRRVRWFLRITTFDLNSPKELAARARTTKNQPVASPHRRIMRWCKSWMERKARKSPTHATALMKIQSYQTGRILSFRQ